MSRQNDSETTFFKGLVKIGCEEKGDQYEFFVEDNGPGIAEEFDQKVFGLFQVLDRDEQVDSTGIGLSIVKKTVEENGGEVRLESAAGQGASFYFTWPKP